MAHYPKLTLPVIVVLGGLLLGILFVIRLNGINSPAHNKDYDMVIQLIQEGTLKARDEYGMVQLPSGYSYLSSDGSVWVHSPVDTGDTYRIFFLSSGNRHFNSIEGYLYVESDVPPHAVDFPGQPYADGSKCIRLKLQWFLCTYYFH